MATKNFIEELEWRGMIHTIMPGAKEQLEKEMTTAYLGIDPTADSLHIGHLVGVMILKHFQMCGHRPLYFERARWNESSEKSSDFLLF